MRIIAYTQYTQGYPAAPKGVELDLFGNEEMVIKYEVDNIREANSKNSSYSKSYDIPATKKNNRFFRQIYDLSNDMKGQPEAVLRAFNPYKSCDVEIYDNGSLLLEGVMFLNSIKESEKDFIYNITVFDKVVGFLDALGESTIADLDFEDIEHEKTIANIQASNTSTGVTLTGGGTSTAVMYPLIDDGQIGYDTIASGFLDIDSRYNLAPCIQLKYILDKMFDFAGYHYESNFFNTTEFKNIYTDSSVNSEHSEITEYENVYARASSNISVPTSWTNVVFTNEITDANNLHNTSTGIYTAPEDNIDANAVISLIVANSNASARTIEFRLVHTSSAANQAASPIYVGSTVIGGSTTQTNVFHFDEVMLNNGDTLIWQMRASASGLTIDAAYTIPSSTPTTTIYSGYYFFTNNRGDGGYIFQHNRRDVRLADIFTDLTKMFNLIIEPDANNPKKIKIEPFNDYVAAGNERNWTDKVDRSEIKQDMFDLPRKITFAMAEDDDDYFLSNYEAIVGKEYGIQEVNIDVETDNEEEIRLDVFAPTAVVSMAPNYAQISVITSSEDGMVFERFSNAPRLFFKNFDVHNAPDGIFDQADVYEGSFGAQVTPYSTTHHYEDSTGVLTTVDSNLLFGNVGYLYHSVNTVPLNTFFEKYWRDYIQERYTDLTHLLKVRVYLKPKDINEFSFKDTVRIDNQTYRVNSIEYSTGGEKLAKVELYRIY